MVTRSEMGPDGVSVHGTATSTVVPAGTAWSTTRVVGSGRDDAATAHWRYAGVPRPDWWSWREERTFRLIGEAVAYERAKRCVAGN